jgi:FkbM family methyltransferase
VIDVGANIGAVTLPLAAYLDQGHVYAIEPTDFAFQKLRVNLALNDQLAARVTSLKTFVADQSAPTSKLVAYSSWPVAHTESGGHHHPVHGGVAKDAECGQMTLDEFTQRHEVSRVDLVKIDTDGHEYAVLCGAARCLNEQRPFVVFEACEYLMLAPQPDFGEFAKLFAGHGYTICHGWPPRPMDAAEFARACPAGGGLDLIAVPDEKLQFLS